MGRTNAEQRRAFDAMSPADNRKAILPGHRRMSRDSKGYQYSIDECAVEDKVALVKYRQKRSEWSNWLEGDVDHAIWQALHGLVWRDVAFSTLSKMALDDPQGPLNTILIGEAIIDGHFAVQVLALRRIIDRTKGVVSLHHLIADVKRHRSLLTRENFVCHDGVPYDYETVAAEVWATRGPGAYWGDTTGPKAHGTSELLHKQFDRLSGKTAAGRARRDVVQKSLLDKVETWLMESGAEEIAKWSHAYLAHAGSKRSREELAQVRLSNDKISSAIRAIARVAEGLSGEILYLSGRSAALMPTAQFDVFQSFERPIATDALIQQSNKNWETQSDQWDSALESVRQDLFSAEPPQTEQA